MNWRMSWRADPHARVVLDRHYSRVSPGHKQFVAPGRSLVFVSGSPVDAVWVGLQQEFSTHDWPGAWMCTHFRNEGPVLSSTLILQALAAMRWAWGDASRGLITFVDPRFVNSTNPGYCFKAAGFSRVGFTRGRNLHVLKFDREWPAAEMPLCWQTKLWRG